MTKLDDIQSDRNTTSQSDGHNRGRWDVTIMMTLVMMAALVKCGYMNEDISNPTTVINTSEVINNKDTLMGKTLTIRSKAVRQIGLSSFTVNDRQLFHRQPIVVVNASGVPFNLPDKGDAEVQVTGQLRNLVITEIERDFNLKLQDEYYTNYTNSPAIIAQSIKLVPQSSQNTQ